MVEIKAKGKVEKSKVTVYGMLGKFAPERDGSSSNHKSVSIKYFSTKVSATPESDGGNTRGLLQLMKPMREHIRAAQLTDLSSVLQRDLNDNRVARELIPYLLGDLTDIVFFPPIVVALLPRGFIQGDQGVVYPRPVSDLENSINYEGKWNVENFTIDGEATSVGSITIFTDETDLVVLDGQHRANAFRYLAGAFNETKTGHVYHPFYKALEDRLVQSSHIASELPVTLIWFESDEEIGASLISRRLFVDVNNNAKAVNESRKILLDDTRVSTILTSSLYESLAENYAFSSDEFSLLHAGYDADNDPVTDRERYSLFALWTPAWIDYALTFFALGNDGVYRYENFYEREASNRQNNMDTLLGIVTQLRRTLVEDALRGSEASLRELKKIFKSELCNDVLELFTALPLVRTHVEATNHVEKWINGEIIIDKYPVVNPDAEVWERVFKGGEGLFSSFLDLKESITARNDDQRTTNPASIATAKSYWDSIAKIEQVFRETRANSYDESVESGMVKKAYETLATKAFLAGYLVAMNVYYKKHGRPVSLADSELIHSIRSYSKENWIHLLTDFKSLVRPELDPKYWSDMRNLVLRVVERNSDDPKFFPKGTTLCPHSPDYKACRRLVIDRIKQYRRDKGDNSHQPSEDDVLEWTDFISNKVINTVRKCDLPSLCDDTTVRATVKHLFETQLD